MIEQDRLSAVRISSHIYGMREAALPSSGSLDLEELDGVGRPNWLQNRD